MNIKATLPNSVTDAIRDMLPSNVSAMLREELAHGAAAIEDNKELFEKIQKLEAELKEHGTLTKREKVAEEREAKLKERETKVIDRELRAELEHTQNCLAAEKKYAGKLEGALAGLVRNTEWRKSVHDFMVDMQYDNNGHCNTTSTPKNSTEAAE